MSDTAAAPSAAPAQSANTGTNPVDRATSEVLNKLPGNTPAPVESKASDTDADIEDTGEDLPKEMTAAQKKAWKLKVGGKEIEIKDENELLKRAQMGYSADEKWQEAARMRKELDSFIEAFQKDPESALEKLGFDVDKMAEKRIERRIEEMKKSPEQLAQEKLEKELRELKSEREREKELARQQEMQRLQDQFATEIETDVLSALDNNKLGLPKSPYAVKRIADMMILAMQEGKRTNNKALLEVKAADVLGMVQEEIKKELQEMYAITPDEVFEQLVGKDRLNKYRRSKIKKKPATNTASASDVRSTGRTEMKEVQEDKPKTKVRERDFFRNLGRK